ncbi:MAG TPA: oligosaccharide flippase family protein [Bacteroidia bacterium]|nr:oligosaccharide flippase family protein [Bacteroidia bacterium]
MKQVKALAGQTIVYGVPSIVGRLLNYLLVPLYTRAFSTSDFGTVTSLYAYVSFLNIVLTYGMETSLFNFSRMAEDKKKVFSTILTSVTVSSLIFLSLAYVFRFNIAAFVKDPTHPDFIVWVALILSADALASVAFAKLREQNKARNFAIIKSFNILIYILFNIFFIVICPKIYADPSNVLYGLVQYIYNPNLGVGYVFISNVASSVITLFMLLPTMAKAGIHFDMQLWKRIMPYALPLLLAGLAGMVNETLDRIILLYLLPDDIAKQQIGIYGACYKISIIITMFVQAFRYAAEPYFFAHSKDEDFYKMFADVTKYFIIGCLLIFLGTMFNLSWIQYFVGKNFRSGLAVVPILLMANLCLGVFYNLSMWYKLAHKTMYGAYLTIFGAVITIAINVIFIPIYGYMASAWATLICYAATMVASYITSRKHFPVKFDMPRIGLYFALSLTLYFVSEHIHMGSTAINLVFDNGMIVAFAIIVYLVERPTLTILNKK